MAHSVEYINVTWSSTFQKTISVCHDYAVNVAENALYLAR